MGKEEQGTCWSKWNWMHWGHVWKRIFVWNPCPPHLWVLEEKRSPSLVMHSKFRKVTFVLSPFSWDRGSRSAQGRVETVASVVLHFCGIHQNVSLEVRILNTIFLKNYSIIFKPFKFIEFQHFVDNARWYSDDVAIL